MKLRTILFAIALTILESSAYSQSYFREGYIEKKTGEVFQGLIKYKVNQKIPDKCSFKRFDIAREVAYNPDEIKAFAYKNGNRYESLVYDNKSTFFEVIVLGKIVLYTRGSDFFIDKDHQGVIEIQKGRMSYNEKEFRDLPEFLNYITEGKSGEIKENFNLKNDLVPLITNYNKESDKDFYVYKRTLSDRQLSKEMSLAGAHKNRFGIISGINIYNLNLDYNASVHSGNEATYLPSPESETGLITGLTYERRLMRKSDKLSLRLDFLYTAQSFYCYKETPRSIWFIREDALFDFEAVKVPMLLQYSFTGRKIIPYINAGAAYQYFISGNYLHITETEVQVYNTISTEMDNDFTYKAGEISALMGFGARTRVLNSLNLHIEARIEYGSGPFVNYNPNIDNTNITKKPYTQNSLQYGIQLGLSF